MFESLSERFEGIFTRLRSKGTLRSSDVDEVLREIRLALLEADVNFVVVKTMLERIRERAVGERISVPVFSQPGDPVATAKAGVEEARRLGRDVCIVDTAGRLAVDAEMMDQVGRISEATQPDYTFLVVDAMTGQDAVTTAESFDATLALDGVILTKLDGDARGGAALSVKEVVGKSIAFASTGEKVEDFDLFHPDRLASRILGMGDMLTLIEKAEQVYEKDQAEEAAAKLLGGGFTLDDFLDQLQQVRKMGPLQSIIGMMPGIPKEMKDAEVDEG